MKGFGLDEVDPGPDLNSNLMGIIVVQGISMDIMLSRFKFIVLYGTGSLGSAVLVYPRDVKNLT